MLAWLTVTDPRPAPRLARAILLMLALLLALAQGAALNHSYSHGAGEPANSSAGKHPGGAAHCATCLLGATLGSAAPPPASLSLALLPWSQPPATPAVHSHTAWPAWRYAIRAPPVSAD